MFFIFSRLWLILWVVCLPLVHIHPEADHAHGMTGHTHGGTFHTVVSSDPVCAYEDHRHHHDSFAPEEPPESSDSSSHPLHGLEHAAYGFPVLNPSLSHMSDGTVADFTSMDLLSSAIETPTLSCASKIPIVSFSGISDSILVTSVSSRASPLRLL